MNNPEMKPRRGLLKSLAALLSAPFVARAATSPAAVGTRRWRKLEPHEIFRDSDLGAAISPEKIVDEIARPGCFTGHRHEIRPVAPFMVGNPVSFLSSPSPKEVSWWRYEDVWEAA
jgi:hypothetical protein